MSEDRNYEAEAREQGWVPESEFKGDEPPKNGFVDAKTFVENGDKITGKLRNQRDELREQVEDLRRTTQELQQFHQQSLKRQQKEYEVRIQELEKKREDAINEGDGQTFTQVDKELNDMRLEQPKQDTSMADAWLEKNSWYKTDTRMSAFADGIAERIVSEGYTGKAYFNELTRRTKEAFPEAFETQKPPGVDSSKTEGDSTPKPKSYEALPADAKQQFERFKELMPNYTKEQYVADYEWD